MRMRSIVIALTMIVATTPVAIAQQLPRMDLTLTTEAFIDPPAYVQEVPARGMSMLAVSDAAGKLVLVQQDSAPQIMLVALSSKGDVIADTKATGFSLPGNEGKKIVNHVLAIVTHPTLPVLYVWQDTASNPDSLVIPRNEKAKQYKHLLIYDISKDQPQLLMSTCSGTDFMIGRSTGMLTLGNQGRRLFVPNLRYDVTRGYGVAIGYYTLNDKGLPILTGAEPEADPAVVSGSPDQDEPAGDESPSSASTATQDANEKVTSGRGGGLTMLHLSSIGSRYQVGRAIYIDDAHTLLRSGNYLATYDTSNRTGRIAAVNIPYANTRNSRLVPHDSLGIVYSSYLGASHLTAWALFNGYPSLMPQHVNVAPYGIFDAVVQITKHKKLALASNSRVLLLSLDERGWIQPTIEQFKADALRVSTLTYSQKFDRLYVGSDAKLEVNP